MKMIIRPACGADVDILWEIDQRCFEADLAYKPDIFYYHLLLGKNPAFVAADEKKRIAGFVLTALATPVDATIVTIDVLPHYRKKGIGSMLIQAAEEKCRDVGVKKMTLQTQVNNEASIIFYQKHGYKNIGMEKDYYGAGCHALVFLKKLK